MIVTNEAGGMPMWLPCREEEKRDPLNGIPWYVAGTPGQDIVITYKNVDNKTDFNGFAFLYGFRG